MQINNVHSVFISLDINSQHNFSLLLTDEGIVQSSDSRETKINQDSKKEAFNDISALLSENILKRSGKMVAPSIEGDVCHILLSFEMKDGTQSNLDVTYGSKSKLPPKEIVDLVKKAYDIAQTLDIS